MVTADGKQSREFTLAPRIGLKADGVVAGDLAEHSLQLVDESRVPSCVAGRCVRMDVGEFGPCDRNHLGGCVQFHRARAERNHRSIECEILVGKTSQVTKHLGLGSVATKRCLMQEVVASLKVIGECEAERSLPNLLFGTDGAEAFEDVDHHSKIRRFVETETNRVVINDAKGDVVVRCARVHRRSVDPTYENRVESRACVDVAEVVLANQRDGSLRE